MCQLNVVMDRAGRRETVMESVTGLEVTADGVVLSTYFEEPLTVPGARIRSIDFLGGSVVLAQDGSAPAEQTGGQEKDEL